MRILETLHHLLPQCQVSVTQKYAQKRLDHVETYHLIPDGVVTEKAADFSEGHSSVAPRVSPVGHVLNTKFLLDVCGIQLPAGMARRVCVCVSA